MIIWNRSARIGSDRYVLRITYYVVMLAAGFALAACQAPPSPVVTLAAEPTLSADFLPPDAVGDDYIPELGNPGYDVATYDLRLTLDPANQFISGHATIGATITGALDTVALDFVGYDVSQVLVNGLAVEFARDAVGRKLIITPPLQLQPGWRTDIDIHYSGAPTVEKSPYNHLLTHVGLHYPRDGSLFAISQPDGARYWFPSNDHPSDKALFTFVLTVPAGLTAVANGTLQATSQTASGQSLFRWAHGSPMAPYLATIAVGDYQLIESTSPNGVPIRHYVKPARRGEFEATTAITGEAIDWMSAQFGPYPFEAFGFVTIDLVNLSLETQTLALLSEYNLTEQIVIHEIAHMWFGDYVSLEGWDEMWRNEGFATYAEVLWNTRNNPAALDSELARLQRLIDEQERDTYTLNTLPANWLFGFENYYLGALFIHDLRLAMGDAAFFGGLQRYLVEYADATASDAEFQMIMEASAGITLQPVWDKWFN